MGLVLKHSLKKLLGIPGFSIFQDKWVHRPNHTSLHMFSLSLICHIKVSQISPTQPYHSGCPQKTRAYYPLMEVITKIHIILFPENKFSAINVCNVTKLFKLFTGQLNTLEKYGVKYLHYDKYIYIMRFFWSKPYLIQFTTKHIFRNTLCHSFV